MLDAKNVDPRPIPELLAAATDWSRQEGEGDWDAVVALQRIGTKEVLEKALELIGSGDPRCRARGADILGQFGSPGRSYPEECLNAAIRLITLDSDSFVLQAAAVALGHLGDPRGTNSLASLVDNPSPEVRHAVAFALGGCPDPTAVAALIKLTTDEDSNVRDWATFGIGQLGEVDTAEVREALKRRLDDPDEGTRYEALCGLAKRRDPSALPILLKALDAAPDDASLYPPAMAFPWNPRRR
jgi:HEAT repeat protein